MISSSAFDYINVLDKALDASWERESIIANNLANVDTPGYKRRDLDFASVLEDELDKSKYVSLDHLTPRVYTDHANFSYRVDTNNVDVDQENVELASEQIRYRALTDCATFEFTELKQAMKAPS